MKLKSFIAKKVYGYLEIDIRFNKDLNFLIGGNGSGKTTALRLINALSIPNFRELLFIPFSLVEIKLSSKEQELVIRATADDELITLRVSDVDQALAIPHYFKSEYRGSQAKNQADEFFDNLNRQYATDPVIKRIAEIPSPVFLGLDRRHENKDKEIQEYFYERDRWAAVERTYPRRLFTGTLGASLTETEFLVQMAYRRLRQIEEGQSNKLKNSILLSTFQYTELEPEDLGSKAWREKKPQLLARRKEIREVLLKLDSNERLVKEFDSFFDRLTAMFETMEKSNDDGINIEWLFNKAQIEKISTILDVIDENKSKIDSIYKPISEFIRTVNSFFSDSQKNISIDTVGRLLVTKPDKTQCSIEGLSSGERQLLVILAHAFFQKFNNKNSEVFIIDEPELSLHLVWQERFAETIQSVNPDMQFILATHSPEIVGSNKRKIVKVRA